MIGEYVTTDAQLEEALKRAKKAYPEYRAMLDFFGQIFTAQEGSKKKTAPAPFSLPHDRVLVKQKEGFPLADLSEFPVDIPAAEALFLKILEIAEKTPGKWAEFARGFLEKTEPFPPPDAAVLFEKFLSHDDAFFTRIAARYGVDALMLALVVYHSLLPSVRLVAEQLSVYLKDAPSWEKGYCPICGSPPSLAALEREGARVLFCAFCSHKWPARRMFCPFCENTDSKGLSYFFAEQEEGFRVEVCERCGKYLKSVDLRAVSHPVYPPLELLTTLHLDMKAREEGYESAVSLPVA